MAEPNEYDRQREERIRRNKAMLAKLQVKEQADNVAAPLLAAQRKKAEAKEAARQKFAATGPARQSQRAGAQRTRAKLQEQAQDLQANSEDEQSGSERSQDNSQSEGRSCKRKRSAQEPDFDPTDLAQDSSSEEEDDLDSSSAGTDAERLDGEDDEDLELQQALAMSMDSESGKKAKHSSGTGGAATAKQKPQHKSAASSKAEPQGKAPAKSKATKPAAKGRKAKAASRVGLINPTADEMKTAFSLFNPHNRSVITTKDICRVALEQGYHFDEDEMQAMMEVAASITERASTSSMTFQGFQKLVEHYSSVT